MVSLWLIILVPARISSCVGALHFSFVGCSLGGASVKWSTLSRRVNAILLCSVGSQLLRCDLRWLVAISGIQVSNARMLSLIAKTDSPSPLLFGWALPPPGPGSVAMTSSAGLQCVIRCATPLSGQFALPVLLHQSIHPLRQSSLFFSPCSSNLSLPTNHGTNSQFPFFAASLQPCSPFSFDVLVAVAVPFSNPFVTIWSCMRRHPNSSANGFAQ